MSFLARAWANSITRECWHGFKRSADHNPVLGMCFVFFIGAIIVPNTIPVVREQFGFDTSQINKTSKATWRVMKDLEDNAEQNNGLLITVDADEQ